MTRAVPNSLLPEVDVPTIARRELGEFTQILVHGIVVHEYRAGDSTGRDVAIASLLRLGLTTDRISSLCGASHGWICRVRGRLRSGGLGEVVANRRVGRPRTIQGAMRAKLVSMVAQGERCATIARALGVAESVVHGEMARIRAPKEQVSLVIHSMSDSSSTPSVVASDREEDDASAMSEDEGEVELETKMVTDMAGVASGSLESETAEMPGHTPSDPAEELAPGAPLPSGQTEHPTRYAGALLMVGALAAIGIDRALAASRVARPESAIYDATTTLLAMMAAWSTGHPSLESMHERDARGLGVVLGLERSPSVRTLHRAIRQMTQTFDPIEFSAAWMRALTAATLPERLVFGIDGHFKPYAGDEPIDKGWDSKRRLATKGIADVFVTDERGMMWSATQVGAGDALSMHVLAEAKRIRDSFGHDRPVVLAFDRGGFAFDALAALDAAGFGYIAYVPGSVSMPPLAEIAPKVDGVGEVAWKHDKLHHHARLLVERDGEALVPLTTNLTTLVTPENVVALLRRCRGAQENAFKAARAHAHIDRLVDRGGATREPDHRPVRNPARAALKIKLAELRGAQHSLQRRSAPTGPTREEIARERVRLSAEIQLTEKSLTTTPAKVSRITLDQLSQRATLDTTNRMMLQPLKLATENARRWLLATLHDGLTPTDAVYDADSAARTLDAILRAPGTVQFHDDRVCLTIDLPLPPTAHARLDSALRAITNPHFRFTDHARPLTLRLAQRPTRDTLPHRTSSAK